MADELSHHLVHFFPRNHLCHSHERNESQSGCFPPTMGQEEVPYLSTLPSNLPRYCHLHLRGTLLPVGMQADQLQMGFHQSGEQGDVLARERRDIGRVCALQRDYQRMQSRGIIFHGALANLHDPQIDMLFLFIPFFMLKGRGVDNRLKLYIYGIFGLGVLYVPPPPPPSPN
jgi:hypothetical protein